MWDANPSYDVPPTAVEGVRVGHAHDPQARTGCTVILAPPQGAVAGVDIRGGAPGTRETDALQPVHLVQRAHAVLLTGGSAFGLAAAEGVVRFLRERGVGFDTGVAKVPIVPAAVLFDLRVGEPTWPSAAMGYQAAQNATAGPVAQGRVGAGMGATVGKLLGPERAMPGGLGVAGVRFPNGLIVSALAVVNALGNVVHPETAAPLAGARGPDDSIVDARQVLAQAAAQGVQLAFGPGENTTLAVVVTNARLDKAGATKVAQMAHDGLARVLRPAHTMLDGDTIFTLATGTTPGDASIVGAWAAEMVAWAVARAVQPQTGAATA